MDIAALFQAAIAIIVAVGGGGAIVLGLSNWIGKIWADRLMEKEKLRHAQEIERLKAELQATVDRHAHNYRQKIDLYKEVAHPVISLVVKAQHSGLTPDDLKEFDADRMATTALLAMFAPVSVFKEWNTLIDYIYDSVDGKAAWSFPEFRNRALKFLSLVRADIGIYSDSVTYEGTR